jgi:hypothetical protein
VAARTAFTGETEQMNIVRLMLFVFNSGYNQRLRILTARFCYLYRL